ncbi:MAG: hypothetical protein K1X88_10130 [Nannocystaceae bacterium]|nr:hypothetical protein [Nannocystaceae bacterium]
MTRSTGALAVLACALGSACFGEAPMASGPDANPQGSSSATGAGPADTSTTAADDPSATSSGDDTVADQSSSAGEAETTAPAGSSSGATEPDAPVLRSLATDVDAITEGEQVHVTALVDDPQGTEDLIGGTLESDDGTTFGPFVATAPGSFTFALGWDALDAVAPIELPQGRDATRTVRARFVDAAGHEVVGEIPLSLHCGALAACDGHCLDTLENSDDCGGCGIVCEPPPGEGAELDACVAGSCATRVCGPIDVTCTEVCGAQGMACVAGCAAEFGTDAWVAVMMHDDAACGDESYGTTEFDCETTVAQVGWAAKGCCCATAR